MANVPWPGITIGGWAISPPAFTAAAIAASMLSTSQYGRATGYSEFEVVDSWLTRQPAGSADTYWVLERVTV